MSDIPTPRSYTQILNDMQNVFTAKTGLKTFSAGNPVLSLLETAAQSDVRSSYDVFKLLDSLSLDRATGEALLRIAADEGTAPFPATAASGSVTITDTSFEKKAGYLYSGKPAPAAGSDKIYVTGGNVSTFPTTGAIYIGRGTTNYEGPLNYTSIAPEGGGVFLITLASSSKTVKYHNANESVVLAQGGNRTVSAGTQVQTGGAPIQYSTVYPTTIPDGETEVKGVSVVAMIPGASGNVSADAIKSFVSAPFAGASVTNPLPFSNGQDAETEDSLKERIRALRQSRSKGTATAIKNSVVGTIASDEQKQVVSASIINEGDVAVLYIDDGAGYEGKSSGVATETLMDRAFGGEQYFQVQGGVPIAKAHLTTSISAPYSLRSGSQLAMNVGGVYSAHTFNSGDFINIGNASAYEVAASINANADLLFYARTAEGGTKVAVFAKSETNDDLTAVNVPEDAIDANRWLGFATSQTHTLRLYKNDRLLVKDGKRAILNSAPQSTWNELVSGETLVLSIDGTPEVEYTFTDSDFAVYSSYPTLRKDRPLSAWAAVFEGKIPGISANVLGSSLALISNVGASDRASIVVSGGTLISKRMFTAESGLSAFGASKDFVLDKSTGQIKLTAPLAEGDKLTAGTAHTRAFIESEEIAPIDLGDGNLWFVLDAPAQIVPTTISAATEIKLTEEAATNTLKIEDTNEAPFGEVSAGDWLIVYEDSFPAEYQGFFRVCDVDAGGTYVCIELDASGENTDTVTLTNVGLKFIRTTGVVQQASFEASANYTAPTLANIINEQLKGGEAYVYRTTKLRVRTNTFGEHGSIALVAADDEGQKISLPISGSVVNSDSHLASVESSNADIGTPYFKDYAVDSVSDGIVTANAELDNIYPNLLYIDRKPEIGLYGSRAGVVSPVKFIQNDNEFKIRDESVQWLSGDRFFFGSGYAIAPNDTISVVVDKDEAAKRFVANLYRKVKPTGNGSDEFLDLDNGDVPVSLALAFGTDFNFNDYAAYMKARAKTHSETTSSILWRYYRYGSEGNRARVGYTYGSAPEQPASVAVNAGGEWTDINVVLPTGEARVVTGLGNKLGVAYVDGTPNTVQYIFGLKVASISKTDGNKTVTAVLEGPANITDCGLSPDDQCYFDDALGIGIGGQVTIKSIDSFNRLEVTWEANSPDGEIDSVDAGSLHFHKNFAAALTGVTEGDIVNIQNGFLDSDGEPYQNLTMKVQSIEEDGLWFEATTDRNEFEPEQETAILVCAISDSTKISFYPLNTDACSVESIVEAVNGLNAAISGTLIGAVGDTSGSVMNAFYENGEDGLIPLVDGLNWIETTTGPATIEDNYSFVFKMPFDGDNADWENEEIRLVPISAKSIAEFLSSSASGGLHSQASIKLSGNGRKVTVASNTLGNEGAIQIQGGTANAASATIVGSASLLEDGFIQVLVPTADTAGLTGGSWVSLTNNSLLSKPPLSSNFKLSTIESDGWITFDSSGSKPWINKGDTTTRFSVRRQGNFVAYTVEATYATPLTYAPAEGDWIYIETTGDATGIQSNNAGLFRVVRSSDIENNGYATFWIENNNAVDGDMGIATVTAIYGGSVLPGDRITIPKSFGEVNGRTWTVAEIDLSNEFRFRVNGSPEYYDHAGAPLSANWTVVEGTFARHIKQIHSISPANNPAFSHITFNTDPGYGRIVESTLRALDKLAFPADMSSGQDGYKYYTGLIGECNKIVFGDPQDPVTYPGVAAVGAKLLIQTPVVKRIQAALAIRTRAGASTQEIASRVRSAVAAAINRAGIGEVIAISTLVSAAASVSGVRAVSVTSPIYNTSNDLIEMQPYEKPMVLDIERDIQVSFVGE